MSSTIFAISYISSSFRWFTYGDFGLSYYFSPLSYPLELNVQVSPLAIYPPIIIFKLDLFGIEIFKINGAFVIQSPSAIQFIVEGATLKITSIIFLINIAFVIICLLILYIVDKRRIGKDFIKYLRSEKPVKI